MHNHYFDNVDSRNLTTINTSAVVENTISRASPYIYHTKDKLSSTLSLLSAVGVLA